MNFEEWQQKVPSEIRQDALWRVEAYRLSLLLADLAWHDVTKLHSDRRTRSLADQLYRSVGSIGANIAEGYSRGTGRDRARFYEYALGSARETRDWYYKARHVLADKIIEHRIVFVSSLIRLLLTMIPQQRGQRAHEPNQKYEAARDGGLSDEREELLRDVPLTP